MKPWRRRDQYLGVPLLGSSENFVDWADLNQPAGAEYRDALTEHLHNGQIM
jgi:hypothetical protein